MQSSFLIVIIAVAVVGVLGAVISLLSSRRGWESFGRDGLVMDSELRDPRRYGAGGVPTGTRLSPAAAAERDTEIRQMLEARNARRRRRGETEVDVDAELARLTHPAPASPAIDDELRAEIRDLVIARNLRRERRGEAPLDVDAEVRREVQRLGGTGGPGVG